MNNPLGIAETTSAQSIQMLGLQLAGSFMATTPAPTLGIQVVIHVETGALEE